MAARTTKKTTASPEGYIGKAPLTILRDAQHRQVYVYRGQTVPAGIPETELLRLAAGGYIAAKETPKAPATTARATSSRAPAKQSSAAEPADDDNTEAKDEKGDGDADA